MLLWNSGFACLLHVHVAMYCMYHAKHDMNAIGGLFHNHLIYRPSFQMSGISESLLYVIYRMTVTH